MPNPIKTVVSYVAPVASFVDHKTGNLTPAALKWAQGIQQAVAQQVTFGTGAPAGQASEGYIYFDTSVSPFQGYVYHAGAWSKFQ